MILIDSNVAMYLVGADHPHKRDARRLLEAIVTGGERLVTNAEVLQEIVHRYAAVGSRTALQPAFDAVLALVDEVFAVELADVELAKQIVLGGYPRLSARDCVHLATMQRRQIRRIMSFDTGFDGYPGVERIH